MNTLDVRIVTLAPMRVASFYGFGPSPEFVAWEKLMAWSRPKGMLDGPTQARIFGFNNPNPSAGSPNYGYEFWIEVDPEVTVDAEDEAEVKIVDVRRRPLCSHSLPGRRGHPPHLASARALAGRQQPSAGQPPVA